MSLHVKTRQDHLKFGPVLRYGPNSLVFSTPRAFQDIYQNPRLAKSRRFENTAVTPGVYSLFNVVDKRAHSYKRKLIGQCTSERSMRIFETSMLEQIDIFLGTLVASAGQPTNMTHRCNRLGIDIVSLLAFGYPLHTQTDPRYRFLIDAHVFGNFRSNLFVQFPFLKATKIYSLLERLAAKDVRRYFQAIETMIASRMAEGRDKRHDLYALIADQINPDGAYPHRESEIWAEAVFFFPAGADTTSTLLSAAFFYLAKNPESYKLLAEEIRATFESGKDIRAGPQLAGCSYLRACIDETLRISPPGSGTSWRELSAEDTSSEPLVIDGRVVPPGVQVGVNIYTLHHNEEYFHDPFVFNPSRWLDPTMPASQRKAMHDAFVPFSIGVRNCPGKPMAYQEASLVLAKTFWYFDFALAPGKQGQLGGGDPSLGAGRERPDEYQIYDIIAATHDGPNLVFRTRGDLYKDIEKHGQQ
ncbi:hypothetical protein G7054_g12513 [Neopestalotiopsis clavispora]|nr:hypothetical protein G7054_g12513 [Neopestalotiopsis clavispora]